MKQSALALLIVLAPELGAVFVATALLGSHALANSDSYSPPSNGK